VGHLSVKRQLKTDHMVTHYQGPELREVSRIAGRFSHSSTTDITHTQPEMYTEKHRCSCGPSSTTARDVRKQVGSPTRSLHWHNSKMSSEYIASKQAEAVRLVVTFTCPSLWSRQKPGHHMQSTIFANRTAVARYCLLWPKGKIRTLLHWFSNFGCLWGFFS
jgi:hypothetical protein